MFSREQANYVKLLYKIADSSSDRTNSVWPGYSVYFEPLLIQFPGVGALLINQPVPPEGFAQAVSVAPELRPAAALPLFFISESSVTARYPASNYTAAYKFNGKETIFFRYGPDSEDILIHEAFHKYQHKYFKVDRTGDLWFDDFSAETIAGMYLEQLFLAKAFLFDGDLSENVKYFIALRASREANTGKKEIDWENYQEMIEGTAKYVETMARLMKAGENVSDPSEQVKLAARLLEPLNRFSLAKGRYYHTGLAQGIILDKTGGDWKKEVESGKYLFDILKTRFPMTAAERAGKAKHIFRGSLYAGYLKSARSIKTDVLRSKASDLRGFRGKDADRFIINNYGIRNAPGMMFSGFPVDVGDGMTASKADYIEFSETDSGILVRDSYVGIKKEQVLGYSYDYQKIEIVPKEISRIEVTLDGKESAQPPEYQEFKTIELRSASLSVKARIPGSWRKQGKIITISFKKGGGAL